MYFAGLLFIFLSVSLASPSMAYETFFNPFNSAVGFDLNVANTSLYLCSIAYCTDTYLDREYTGAGEGFVPYSSIYDSKYDTHGYIGYRESDHKIYVVYRGTKDVENWIDNMEATLVDYPHCDGCKVHNGWYKAMGKVIDQVLVDVATLAMKFPGYKISVTGHSLGAAMATLTFVELATVPGYAMEMYNFGCPRVGNTAFSEWFGKQGFDTFRITHHKDMVPHTPMHERFTHISGEWYHESDIDASDIHACKNGPEDPDCSYQWHMTSIDDHLLYLGTCTSCPDNAANLT